MEITKTTQNCEFPSAQPGLRPKSAKTTQGILSSLRSAWPPTPSTPGCGPKLLCDTSCASEEMSSCPLHPRLGDDATRLERRPVVAYVVEDEVEDFRREGGRHRSLCQSCLDAVFHHRADPVHGSNPVLSSILQHSCSLRTFLITNENTVVSDLHPHLFSEKCSRPAG
jgi:hypothetical protein